MFRNFFILVLRLMHYIHWISHSWKSALSRISSIFMDHLQICGQNLVATMLFHHQRRPTLKQKLFWESSGCVWHDSRARDIRTQVIVIPPSPRLLKTLAGSGGPVWLSSTVKIWICHLLTVGLGSSPHLFWSNFLTSKMGWAIFTPWNPQQEWKRYNIPRVCTMPGHRWHSENLWPKDEGKDEWYWLGSSVLCDTYRETDSGDP